MHTKDTTVPTGINTIFFEILDFDVDNCKKNSFRDLYRNLLNNFLELAAALILRLGELTLRWVCK